MRQNYLCRQAGESVIEIIIPQLPKMPNQLLRRHWSIVMNEKKKWHSLVALEVFKEKDCTKLAFPCKQVILTLTRKSTSQPDFDGLVGSFKYVIDGLVKAGVIVDDNANVIADATYQWTKCKRIEQGISVIVQTVNATP
jgi:Holliday junction resolvase RusA-like endonuclease